MDPLLIVLALGGVSMTSVLVTWVVMRSAETASAGPAPRAAAEPAPEPAPQRAPLPVEGHEDALDYVLDYGLDDDTMDPGAHVALQPQSGQRVADDDDDDHPTVLYQAWD